jgi:hypothetical protein
MNLGPGVRSLHDRRSCNGEGYTSPTNPDRLKVDLPFVDFTETILPVLLRDTSMEVKQDTIDGHIKVLIKLLA